MLVRLSRPLWLMCGLYVEELPRTSTTWYQLKTKANARLTNMVASDALLRGHSVCWIEPATGPLGMNISASRLKVPNRQTDRQTDRLNLSDGCVSTKLRVTGNHSCFILFILNCISLYTHVYWALSNSICYNFPQLAWQLCCHVLTRLTPWKYMIRYRCTSLSAFPSWFMKQKIINIVIKE